MYLFVFKFHISSFLPIYLLLFELSKWEEKNTYEKFLSLISGGFVKP